MAISMRITTIAATLITTSTNTTPAPHQRFVIHTQ